MFCKFSNSSHRSVSLLTLDQNVFNLPFLVNGFHLFYDILSFNMPSNSYLVAQKDSGDYDFLGLKQPFM